MATSRELKELLRPLLACRAELAFAGRTLFFQPFTHYLRGVVFLTSRFHPASQAISFAHQLYNGQGSPDFDVNRDRHRYQMKLDWKEAPERASLELCDEMEHRALPAVEGIVDFAAHMRAPGYMGGYHPDTPSRVFVEALGYCSVGEFDKAEVRLSGFERELPEFSAAAVTEDRRYDRFPLWRMAYLLRALRNDQSQVLPLLHDWEEHAVKGMKLTKFWKPTPFPAEL